MSRLFRFTGFISTDVMTVSPSASLNNLFKQTGAVWVRINSIAPAGPNGSNTVMLKSDAAGNNVNEYLSLENQSPNLNTFVVQLFDGVNFAESIAPSGILTPYIGTGVWVHLAYTYDGNIIRLFLNGMETAYGFQQAAAVSINDVTADLTVGQASVDVSFGNVFEFDGDIAELALWNTNLSPSQVAAAAASTAGVGLIAPGNLVGYWHLCGKLSPEPDASGNGNSGTVTGTMQDSDSPGFNCSPLTGGDHVSPQFKAWVRAQSNRRLDYIKSLATLLRGKKENRIL